MEELYGVIATIYGSYQIFQFDLLFLFRCNGG